jgi:PAS domain S-box-containing protein
MKDQLFIPPAIQRNLRILVWIGIILVGIIAFLDIIGWSFDIPWLKSLGLNWLPMKPVSAICFILCVTALVFITIDPVKKSLKIIPRLSGVIVSFVGLLTIIVYSAWLISGSEITITGSTFLHLFLSPGNRMAFVIAVNFLVIGVIIIMLSLRIQQSDNIAHGLLILPVILSYLVPLSYILGTYHLYEIKAVPVPLSTGITFCLLCFTLFCIQPYTWFMKPFTGRRAGSKMARRLLPGLIILPVVIGWFRIKGEQSGWFESEVGVVLVALTYTVCFLWLVWLTADSVNKSDEESLRNEALLKEAQRIARIGTWEWDIHTGRIIWSDQMYQIFGEKKGKFIPTFDEFLLRIHPGDRKHTENVIRDAINRGVPYEDEYRILPRKTDECYVIAHADIFRDQQNNVARLIGTVMDITDRKKAEEALRMSQERFSTTLSSIGDAVISTDVDGNVLFLNRVSEELTGWKQKDALGKPVKEVFHIINEHTRAEVESPVKLVLDKGMIMGLANHTILVRKDGTEIPIDDSGAPIRGKDGNIEGVVLVFRDITERKKAERVIYQAKEDWERTFDAIPDLISIIDSDHRIRRANQAMAERLGLTPDKCVGLYCYKVIHNLDHPPQFCPHSKLLKDSCKHEIEIRENHLGSDFHVSTSPVLDNQGHLFGSVHVIRDITEHKKVEEEIRQTRDYLEKCFNYANAPFICWDPNFRITRFNRAFERMTSYTQEEVLGKELSLLFPEETKEESLNKIKRTLAGEHWEVVEIPILRKNGDIRIALWNSANINAEDGKSLITTIAQGQDITERKKAEEALRQSHLELEQKVLERTSELNRTLTELSNEQTRFREVLDILPSYVALLTPDYYVSFANREFKKRFGEAPGKRCYEHLFKRNEPCEICHTYEVLKTDKCIFWEWQGPDGNTYSVSDLPFTDPDGSKLILEIGSDITKIKEAENDRIARQVAEQANRTKSEFLANVSHEIRTPMNAIIGFSDLLISTIQNEKQRSQINAIRSSSKTLLSIINDILDLSKIEAGKMVIHPEPVNFSMVINEIEMIFANKAREKGIGFFVETEKEVPHVLLVDETRLRQVLFNLLDNAIKFTDQGHVILTIDRLFNDNNKIDLVLSIEDTGIGIPADQHDLVFNAFSQQQGLPEKKYGGTGLGLTITRRLVELMGGTVNLTSEPGKGSIFTILLPGISIVHEARTGLKAEVFDISTIHFRKSRILIADDNFENRKLLVDLFEPSSLELIEARNGKEAFELATKYQPDLILMDLRMPEMNGYEATRLLKKQDTTKTIPVVALSASPKIVLTEQSDKDLFNDFIMKPVVIADLVNVLKKYLAHQTAGKEKDDHEVHSGKPIPEMTKKQKQQLHGLIKTLEKEYLPVYIEALTKQMISQIDLFGQNLTSLGEESGSGLVTDYGRSICTYAESFDVELLLEKLRLFPEIIDRLKKSLEA